LLLGVFRLPLDLLSPAVGVGQHCDDEDADAAVRSANTGGGDPRKLDVITERAQLGANHIQPSAVEPVHVLEHDPARAGVSHDA
jgi:hypothetical protein